MNEKYFDKKSLDKILFPVGAVACGAASVFCVYEIIRYVSDKINKPEDIIGYGLGALATFGFTVLCLHNIFHKDEYRKQDDNILELEKKILDHKKKN